MNKIFIILQLFLLVSYTFGEDNITYVDEAIGEYDVNEYDVADITEGDVVIPQDDYLSLNETQEAADNITEDAVDAAVPLEETDAAIPIDGEEENNQTEETPDQDPDSVVPIEDYDTEGKIEADEIDAALNTTDPDIDIRTRGDEFNSTDVDPNQVDGSAFTTVVEEPAEVVPEVIEEGTTISLQESVESDLCPSECECDVESQKISCASKNLNDIPSQIGFGYTSIDLKNNQISSIDKNLLKTYGNITEIVLTNNNIQIIDEESFSEVPKLVHIGLSGNDLRVIHPNAFINNKNLAAICLNNNTHLQIAEGESLLNIPSLKHLNLIGSNITQIPESFFDGTRGLESLNLADNPLVDEDEILNARAFSVLKNLTKLTVPESLNNISLSFLCTYCDNLYDVCIDSCDTKNISCLYLQTHIEIEKYGEFVNHTGNILAKYGTEVLQYMERFNGTNIDLQNKLKELINTDGSDFTLDNLPGKVIDNLGKVGDFLNSINEAAKVEEERIKNVTAEMETPDIVTDDIQNNATDDNIIRTIDGRMAVGKDEVDAVQPHNLVEEIDMQIATNETNGKIVMASSAGGISGRTVDNILIGIIIVAIIALVAFVVVKRNWRKIKTRFSSSEPAPSPDRELEEIPLRNKV